MLCHRSVHASASNRTTQGSCRGYTTLFGLRYSSRGDSANIHRYFGLANIQIQQRRVGTVWQTQVHVLGKLLSETRATAAVLSTVGPVKIARICHLCSRIDRVTNGSERFCLSVSAV